ncbi:MAG TPA: 3'-5' exonuclease [Rhizomicrobium sp.]|nr:3'-5' exonuclease [Rhizomicrobium sp.]
MPHAVLYDLEYTAWEGSMAARWLRPGEFRELVQIGAVKIDADTLSPLAEFEILVKPRINRVLSPYFETLTGIGNAAIAERGVDFGEAYNRFVAFADGAPIFSFGRDDLVLTHNVELYGIADAPPLPVHHNIMPWLNTQGVETKGRHACDIARLCGVADFSGREHDALDDARSIAAGTCALIRRGADNLFRTAQA